jgi:hypothetical protein
VSLITIGDVEVIKGSITFPRIGVWHMDAVVDQADATNLTGAVTVGIGDSDLTLNGTAYRVGELRDTVSMRIVAGAAGLGTICTPKAYGNMPLRTPLGDILSAAGETLSNTADPATLSGQLAAWSILGLPCGEMIDELASFAGVSWRMLADGTCWVGPETWPDSTIDYQLIDGDPKQNRFVLGVELPVLLPGTTLDIGKVSYVIHEVTPDSTRSIVWLEDQ